MSTASFPPCWERTVFLILEDIFFLIEKAKYFDFFYSEFVLEILIISHEKVKKTNKLNAEIYLTFSKKMKKQTPLG